MKIGYIGLGKMGKNMVLRLLEGGIEVVAWNRTDESLDEVVKAGAVKAESVEDLVNKLRSDAGHPESFASLEDKLREGSKLDSSSLKGPAPQNDKKGQNDDHGVIIWLMLPAGEITNEYIDKLSEILDKDDLVIDGGNSFYKDTLRHAKLLSEKGIHFMDVGVSGGPKGARTGACLMIGGSEEDFERIKPLVIAASAPDSFAHLGKVGAGHFAKMVHNGIEYGMMEAIAEGAAILKTSQFEFDFNKLFDLYNHRSVIESRLVEWAREAFNDDPNLSEISSEIKSTGEGKWAVETAKELMVDTPVLEASVKIRENSKEVVEESPDGFRNKVVSAMRGKFGGHEVKKENGQY